MRRRHWLALVAPVAALLYRRRLRGTVLDIGGASGSRSPWPSSDISDAMVERATEYQAQHLSENVEVDTQEMMKHGLVMRAETIQQRAIR